MADWKQIAIRLGLLVTTLSGCQSLPPQPVGSISEPWSPIASSSASPAHDSEFPSVAANDSLVAAQRPGVTSMPIGTDELHRNEFLISQAESPWVSDPTDEIELTAHTEDRSTQESAGPELTLAAAIHAALDANPDLSSASEQIRIADATLARAQAEFFPRLGLVESYGVSNNPVNVFSFQLNQAALNFNQDFNNPKSTDNLQSQFLLQHNLYSGGRRHAEADAADSQRSAAWFSLAAVQNQLVFRVAEAYYRLLQTHELLDVRREAVEQVEQHLEIVQSRFRNETAVKSDVLTVEVRLSEVNEALITAQNQHKLAWAVLQNVTGTRLKVSPLPRDIPAAPWSDGISEIETAVSEALSARPEAAVMAHQREAASSSIIAAEAGDQPTLDFLADYSSYTGDLRRENDSFFVGLVLKLNLFDGGRTRSEVERAQARLREVCAREQRHVLDIELDVRRASLQLDDARQRFKVAGEAIELAKESLREIEVRYRGQASTITELIDAQVALSNARVRRTNAQADVEIARASLQRSIGRLTNVLQH